MLPENQLIDTGRVKPIFKNGKFSNPFPSKPVKMNPFSAIKIHFTEKGTTRPPQPLPADSADIKKAFPEGKGLYITWLGHSSFLMQIDGVRILIDPVFENDVSPVALFSIKRFQKKSPANPKELPFIDAVFISHNHRDHLERQTIMELAENTGFFLVPLGVGDILRGWGVDAAKIREFNWWQEGIIKGLSGQTLKFACTPARHFSGRGLTDWNKTLWVSWVFIGSEHKVFYSGDTSYGFHFKQIGHLFGPFDLTLIENGQYSIHWPDSHIMPEDGVKAHLELKGKYMLPAHWGSFNLSIHDWHEPIQRVSKEAKNKGIKLLTPRIGQTLHIYENLSTPPWWEDFIPLK
ncbi:MAG: MBL fold metallo-hydrolase [Fibromonadaceae bacterium]|nr:MBL fold metallo-hydrolase [Fibromonadaceae bacterium]